MYMNIHKYIWKKDYKLALLCACVCVCVHMYTYAPGVCKGRKRHKQKDNIWFQEEMLHLCANSDLKKMTSNKYLGIFTSLHLDRSCLVKI